MWLLLSSLPSAALVTARNRHPERLTDSGGSYNTQVDDHERSVLLDPEAQLSDAADRGGARAGAGPSSSSSASQPGWTAQSRKVQSDLALLGEKIRELEALHSKTSLTRFSDLTREEQMVEVVSQEATGLVIKCKKGLDALSRPSPGEHPSEGKVRENARRKLALQLQELVVRQRGAQKKYLQKLKDKEGGAGSAVFSFLEQEMGSAGGGADVDTGFNPAQLQRLQQMEGVVDSREREVMGIMQSINDLMEIMHDLSVLVIDQGTMLDRIDYNVQKVVQQVESGVLEIKKAERTQRASRNWLIIGVLLALVLVMFVVVAIKYA